MAIPKMLTSANLYVGVGFNLGKAKYMRSMQPINKQDKKNKKKSKTTPAPASPTATTVVAML